MQPSLVEELIVPENLPAPSERYRMKYQQYEEEMKTSYKQYVQQMAEKSKAIPTHQQTPPAGRQTQVACRRYTAVCAASLKSKSTLFSLLCTALLCSLCSGLFYVFLALLCSLTLIDVYVFFVFFFNIVKRDQELMK